MKVFRDRVTKEVLGMYNDAYDHINVVGKVTPVGTREDGTSVPLEDIESIRFPDETIDSIQEKQRRVSPNGKLGRIKLHDDGTWEVFDPVIVLDGLIGELDSLRTRANKLDNAPLTFGDVKNIAAKMRKDRYDRI